MGDLAEAPGRFRLWFQPLVVLRRSGEPTFPWYGVVEQRGIEHQAQGAPRVVERHGNDADRATQDDERRREVSALGDVVELALARAIDAEVRERLSVGRRE